MTAPRPFIFGLLILVTVIFLVGLVLTVNYYDRSRFFTSGDRPGLIEQLINPETADSIPQSNFVINEAPPANEELAREILLTTAVVRGEVVDMNRQDETIVVRNDHSSDQKLRTLDLHDLPKFKCWPELQTTNNTQISLREAYIPFNPNQPLSWVGETIVTADKLWSVLDVGGYIFAKLVPEVAGSVIVPVSELAVLGCL